MLIAVWRKFGYRIVSSSDGSMNIMSSMISSFVVVLLSCTRVSAAALDQNSFYEIEEENRVK